MLLWRKRRRVDRLRATRRHVVGFDDEQAASILWIRSYKNLMSRSLFEREIDHGDGG